MVVAFSLWRLSRNQNPEPQTNTNITTNSSQASVSNSFSIVGPQDASVVDSDTIDITGLSNSNAVIVAYSSDEIFITKANSQGEFSLSVELSSGINNITMWSFEKGQSPKELTTTIVYTTQLELEEGTATAVFGTVTDIAEDTLQVRTATGEINQLAISDDTTFVKIVDDAEDIAFSDVAIGDYIAGLGQAQNSIVSVGRVLVTTEPEVSAPTAIIGTIETLSASEFFVNDNETSEQVSVDATGSVTTYSAKEAEIAPSRLSTSTEGDEIIIIGELEEELLASTIILL